MNLGGTYSTPLYGRKSLQIASASRVVGLPMSPGQVSITFVLSRTPDEIERAHARGVLPHNMDLSADQLTVECDPNQLRAVVDSANKRLSAIETAGQSAREAAEHAEHVAQAALVDLGFD